MEMADLGIISTHEGRDRGEHKVTQGESVEGIGEGPRVKPAENWHMGDWSGKEIC